MVTIGEFKRERLRRRKVDPLEIATQSRRAARGRRRNTLWTLTLASLLLLLAAAPSVVCHSSLATLLIRQHAPHYGWTASAGSIRIGWLTPLRISALELAGTTAGTQVRVEQLDADVNLLQCLGGLKKGWRVSARGVNVELSVDEAWSSLEADLVNLMSAEDSQDEPRSGHDRDASALDHGSIDLQNLTLQVQDRQSGVLWTVAQGHLEASLAAGRLDAKLSAIMSEPQAGSGAIDAVVHYEADAGPNLRAAVNLHGLPLGAAALIRRRLPETAAVIPNQLAGDASGAVEVTAGEDGWSVVLSPLELRNLVASDPALGEHVWRNGLAVAQGSANIDAHGLTGQSLRITTDFAELSLDGTFASLEGPDAATGPATWLTSLRGTATASVDLVALTERLPGALPLREQTELVSGQISAEITTESDADGHRVHGYIRSEAIHARASGRTVVLDPAAATVSLRVDSAGGLRADGCQLSSAFGSGRLDGDLSNGRATADLDLGRLAAMLDPLVELPNVSLGGVASGQLQWAARSGDQWQLQGDGQATELTIGWGDGLQLHRPNLAVQVDASGRWDGTALRELTAAEISLRSSALEADAVLLASLAEPTLATAMPLRLSGRGRLEVLAEFLSPWLPTTLHSLNGGFSGQAEALIGLAGGELTTAQVELQEPRGGWNDRLFAQRELSIGFRGNLQWPSGNLVAQSLRVVGDSVDCTASGTLRDDTIDCELNWQAQLAALQGTVDTRLAERVTPRAATGQTSIQSVGFAGKNRFAPAPSVERPSQQWLLTGNSQGSLRLRRVAGEPSLNVLARATGTDLELLQPTAPRSAPRPNAVPPAAGDVVWAEPTLQLEGELVYAPDQGKLNASKLLLSSDWLSTTLTGVYRWNDQQEELELTGPARIRMPQVANQLTQLAGTEIRLEGIHETPVAVAFARKTGDEPTLNVRTSLGWEAGEIAGVVFGPSSLPLLMSETTVTVEPVSIPVGQGRIQGAGQVHYRPGPLTMQVKPGVIAQNLRLTPELTERWLQYLAPVVAQATRIDGTFGVELSEATINLEAPQQSRVRGQLQINQVDLDSGALTNQLLSSIQQIQAIARGRGLPDSGAGADAAPANRRLATLPTQSVDFDFADGVISHQRMFIEIDRAQLVTSGRVHVDGQLDLIAQVPLQAAWLGSDLKALAGRPITLPIGGTLSRPRLDPAAIRDLVGQVGAQALQSTAENYLEKQLNRGLEKLLGK